MERSAATLAPLFILLLLKTILSLADPHTYTQLILTNLVNKFLGNETLETWWVVSKEVRRKWWWLKRRQNWFQIQSGEELSLETLVTLEVLLRFCCLSTPWGITACSLLNCAVIPHFFSWGLPRVFLGLCGFYTILLHALTVLRRKGFHPIWIQFLG